MEYCQEHMDKGELFPIINIAMLKTKFNSASSDTLKKVQPILSRMRVKRKEIENSMRKFEKQFGRMILQANYLTTN